MIELDLGQRILGCLERAGITDDAQLLMMTNTDLARIPGLGRNSVMRIREILIKECGWRNEEHMRSIAALRRKIRYHEERQMR